MSTTLTTIKSSGLVRALAAQGRLQLDALDQYAESPLENRSIARWLISNGLAESTDLAAAVATHFGYPLFDVSQLAMDHLSTLDSNLLQASKGLEVVVLGCRGNQVYVGIADPTDLNTLQQVKFRTQMQVDPVVVEYHRLINFLQNSGEQAAPEGLEDEPDAAEMAQEAEDADIGIDDAPIVRFVQRVLMDAIKLGASDIHLEPYEKQYRIRYRIDGVLKEMAQPPISAKSKIAARIKVMSRLNTTETRIPQDGRLRLSVTEPQKRKIDFRVSTLPTVYGEKIVLRILDSDQGMLRIEQLGMNDRQMTDIKKALEAPHGMILVTGPTGSGKTVSLYTFLNMLNKPTVNISTVEDPAEINLQGINQVNINEKIGLNFAKTLRALLRQDPDIIMVGEIRDLETADISIKASQTGHLVLSTLHTNDAVSTIVRLANMGVEPFNVASSINLVIAQRLIRKLCSCKQPHPMGRKAMVKSGLMTEADITQEDWTPFCAVGCELCNETGYSGRTGIYQVMPVSETLREMILDQSSPLTMEEQVRKEGVIDMRESGTEKIRAGITSIEEVLGATKTD